MFKSIQPDVSIVTVIRFDLFCDLTSLSLIFHLCRDRPSQGHCLFLGINQFCVYAKVMCLAHDAPAHNPVPAGLEPRTSRSSVEPPRGKTNNVVYDQVRHKPTCTSTEKS